MLRPGLHEFLDDLVKYYEIGIFTASTKEVNGFKEVVC
jgi:TFIIF-interacting CTD phosphatase-like protein